MSSPQIFVPLSIFSLGRWSMLFKETLRPTFFHMHVSFKTLHIRGEPPRAVHCTCQWAANGIGDRRAWHRITSFRGKRRWNEMSRHLGKKPTSAGVSVVLSHGDRKKCWVCFPSMWLSTCFFSNICQSQASWSSAPLPLFTYSCFIILYPPIPPFTCLYKSLLLFFLSIHLVSFLFYFLSLAFPPLCIYILMRPPPPPRSPLTRVDVVESWWITLHVMNWRLSESHGVNMVCADSAVKIVTSGGALRHSHALARLPRAHSAGCVCVCVGSICLDVCVFVFVCMCVYIYRFFFPAVKGQQNKAALLCLCLHVSSLF